MLETVNLDGRIAFLDGKWKESMTIGRACDISWKSIWAIPPALPVIWQISSVGNSTELDGLSMSIPVKAVVVFTHPLTKLEVKKPPCAGLHG